jgi:predicted dehydrogenase
MLNVLIIGCGNIAGRFDEGVVGERLPLTHAGAFVADGGFRLAACVEADQHRRLDFMSRWSIPHGYANLSDLRERVGEFDVVSICSPTAVHAEHLEAALQLRPRLIFSEKPVTPSVAQTTSCVEKCAAAGVLLAVNHTRRWAPDVRRLSEDLRSGHWGTLRSVVCHYNKGVMNNGGHMIDLLRALLGEVRVVGVGRPIWDFWEDDPTVTASLLSESDVPVYLNATHAGDFSYFEVQFFTSTAVIAMEDGGAHWRIRRATDSPTFRGYKSLGQSEQRPGEYARSMLNAAANIRDAVLNGATLASTGDSALSAQRVCEQIRLAAGANPKSSQALHGESA